MTEIQHVVIGIQARSTSTRLPNKIMHIIQGKPVLNHVLERCEKTENYINRHTNKSKIRCTVAIVCPKGDQLAKAFKDRAIILEGDENNVLSRYITLQKEFKADFLVRITSDCILIPSAVITKHINVAINEPCDYVHNTDPELRTSIDGHDCEVLSAKALRWLEYNATENHDLEHVTTLLKRDFERALKDGIKYALIFNDIDLSSVKLSIDTQQDMDRVRDTIESINNKKRIAIERYGRDAIHHF